VLAVILAWAALLATACGGGSSPAVAGQAAYQKALAYAQCMRGHGQPQFPDPNSQGNFLLPASTQGSPNSAAFVSANKACQHLLPKTRPMTAAQQRQVTAQALKFVACMRSHGLPNMPDPIVNSGGIGFRIGGGPGSTGPKPSMPVVQAAQRACQKLMPGAPP
jgi:hypothetical protein